MVNLAGTISLMQKQDAALGRLRTRADQLVATPPTMANFGQLPHVLQVLAAIDQARARRPYLLSKNAQIHKLTQARGIAIAVVQHLLVEAETTMAGLESNGIKDCASLLRQFESLMTLVDPNCSVSEAFQALDRQIEDFKAEVVDKATAMLQDMVACASAYVPTKSWLQLLRDLGDFEDLLSIDPTVFFGADAIWAMMDRIVSVFCPLPTRARSMPALPVLVNQVGSDQHNNATASSAFGGICSNILRSALGTTFGRIWIHSPLPKFPCSRTIAVNWITTHLYEQASLLRAQCQAAARPQESPDAMSIALDSLSDDTYFRQVHSIIHVVHLPPPKTYHLTTYREHIVHLSFETVVQWRKTRLAANEAKSPPREKFGSISLRFVASTDGLLSYCMARDFDGDADYCSITSSITKDDDKAKCPDLDGYKREWTSWMIVTKLDDSSTSVVQITVALGLQHTNGSFVPYDNYVSEQDSHNRATSFEVVARQLKKYSADVFENDAQRCINELKEVGTSASVVKVESAAAANDNSGEDHGMDGIMTKDEGTRNSSNSHAASDALDMHSVLIALPAPASSARTPTIVAATDHSLTSSAARAGPKCNRHDKRGRNDSSDVEEIKRARSEVRLGDELCRTRRPACCSHGWSC